MSSLRPSRPRVLLLSAIVVALLAACTERGVPEPALALTGETMGTRFEIRVAAVPPSFDAARFEADALAVLADTDELYSGWRTDSILSRFNATQSTEWFAVPAEFCALLERALAISKRTGGAFDPTVASLVDAWGFGRPEVTELPQSAAIERLLASVGYRKVELDCDAPALRKLVPGVAINLAGFAKGHAVDRLAVLAERDGIARYIIDIGGELRLSGNNAQNEPWRIAIENAGSPGEAPVAVLRLNGGGLATSGSYRNQRLFGEERVTHILDPATGQPVQHDLLAVSVVAATTAEADALATALMVMGPDRAPRFATDEDIAALFQVRSADGIDVEESAALWRIRSASE